jgi:hypothetical protein
MRGHAPRLPSPAIAVAFIALIVALGGTGYAASRLPGPSATAAKSRHRRSRDRRQDKRLFRSLFDASIGKAHVAFATAAASAASAQNAADAAHATSADSAPLPTTLPSGQSLSGAYGLIGHATGASQRAGAAISFQVPLASAPTAHLIEKGSSPPPQCPGTATDPKASPGNLCIYESRDTNFSSVGFENPITGETGGSVPAFGAEVVGFSAAAGNYTDSGSWAVTAP